MRNGKSDFEPGAPGARQETLAVGARPPGSDVDSKVEQHLRVAFGLLKEGQSPQAFGELVHASRTLPMTRRLAATLVNLSFHAGTEAVAITLLGAAVKKVEGKARREVQRQLARVLRRADQLPKAIETLDALLYSFPKDLGARRVHQVLLERTGRWEALATSLENEAQEAVLRGKFARAARAARWRARVQAEQLRNMSRAAESYGQVANYLEKMGDADGAFTVRLDGLRVLHSSGASESVLTAAASVCMSAAARLGRDAQARHVLEELGLIPSLNEAPPTPEDTEPEKSARSSEPRRAEPEPQPAGIEVQPAEPKAQPTEPEPRRAEPEKRRAAPELRHTEFEAWLDKSEPQPNKPGPQRAEPKARPPEPEPQRAASVPGPATSKTQAAEPEAEEPAAEARTAEPAAQPDRVETSPGAPEEESAAPEAHAVSSVVPAEMYLPRLQVVLDAAFSGQTEGALPSPQPAGAEAGQAPPQEAEGRKAAELNGEAGSALTSEEPTPAPLELWNDPVALQRLEAQLIARKSWQELAQFYLTRADRAKDASLRAEALTRLAELMENELGDPSGAARIYREIVKLTGDRDALKEQLRLLAQRGEPSLVRRALDEAVHQARTPKARAAAYLTRAERALADGETAQAKADFETAEALTPGLLLVLSGLVRCVSDSERPAMAQRLRAALTAAPRRSPDRMEALRALASIADEPLKDAKLAQWAWSEVLAEDPAESGAHARLVELARKLGDKATLTQLLREQLTREPRGTAARLARMELVSTLEESGDVEGGLSELRQAVRFEPGHKEAWLLLADRLTERGQIGEAAWAMEHAATAMEDEAERQRAWVRLASFCYSVLKDPARGELYSRRAENLRQALLEKSAPPPVPEAPRSESARREGGTRTRVLVPPPLNVNLTPAGQPILPEVPPLSEVTDPALVVPAHARKTQEVRVSEIFKDKEPFEEEESTATDAPEGAAPPDAKPATALPKNLGRKLKIEPMDPSRELDSLLGSQPEDDSGHTSPSLSAWSLKRPPGLAAPKSQKASAPVPPPTPEGRKTTAEQPTGQRKRSRTRTDEVPQAFVPDTPVPPSRSALPHLEDTSPGRRTGPKAAVPASSPTKGSRGTPRPEPADSPFAKVSPREPDSPPAQSKPSVQNTSFISWEAPPGKMDPVRRVARPRAGTSSRQALPPEPHGPEPAVFKQVREHPLEAELYVEIAEYFHQRGDKQRAELMQEIADALDGRESPPPRPPRQPLSSADRSGLRHPLLRSPAGELLTCVGVALCRLFPMHGRAAGTQERLRPSLGPGAPGAIDAFETSQRLLAIEAPDVVLAEDNGPPFSLVFTSAPRLLVGKQAVRQVLPGPELRFYAGRALLCLGPDLLALRSLKKDQILRGMALLSSVLKDKNASGLEARVMRESLTSQQIEQAAELFGPATRDFNVSALADAARDSSNRAGLVTCGAVGPALAALRMKRALEREIVELVRFAASERYFQLRTSG
ncbi:MAG TPA: hypothetical protein VNA24_06305 [Hyalangium sp.]|nr:hypothetical protein [Hyalangium sp.]